VIKARATASNQWARFVSHREVYGCCLPLSLVISLSRCGGAHCASTRMICPKSWTARNRSHDDP
jgi:hypothetical protein